MKKEAFWRSSKNKYYLSSYLAWNTHAHTYISPHFYSLTKNQHFYYRHFGFYSKVMHIHLSLTGHRISIGTLAVNHQRYIIAGPSKHATLHIKIHILRISECLIFEGFRGKVNLNLKSSGMAAYGRIQL